MVVLLEMLKRGEQDYPGVYQRSLKIWRKAWAESQKRKKRKDIDYFIPICKVERHLRKNQNEMVLNTTAPVGNRETKRVYSFEEGTIGPINQILSNAGGRLKFLGMTRYFLPTPARISYEYTLRNGRTKVESGYGYLGSTRSVKVIVTHPTLPSLDFVDMIRAPLVELSRECFNNSVLGATATPYIEELILRLRPYLDHIYTRKRTGYGSKVGTDRFVERVNDILDTVLLKIRAHCGTRSASTFRITSDTGNAEQHQEAMYSLKDIHIDSANQHIGTTLEHLLERGIVVDEDFDRLAGRILTLTASRGTQIHRRLSWGLPSPPSEVATILGGDYYARSVDGYLLSTEVPVWSGRGKADFVLSVRRSVTAEAENEYQAQGDWQPVLVVDTKTKAGVDCGFVGRQIGGTSSIVIDEACKKRGVTDDEWNEILANTPSLAESRQLKAYASGLASSYERFTNDDLASNALIVRGILALDETENKARTRDVLEGFFVSVYEQIQRRAADLVFEHEKTDKCEDIVIPKSVYEIESRYKKRIALVTEPLRIPMGQSVTESLPEPSKLSSFHGDNLFANRILDSREFILYVSAPAPGAGKMASWIARYWHGFDFIHSLARENAFKKIIWLDLGREFSDPQLRRAFLRRYALGTYQNESENPRNHIRDLVDSIEFCDLFDTVFSALMEGKKFPSIRDIEVITKGFELVIISGMDTIRKAVSSANMGLVQLLEVCIAEGSSKSSAAVWFDSMVSTPHSSRIYKQHRCAPLSYDSPLQVYIDEIIINHHLPPNSGISESPDSDETRCIIKMTPSGYEETETVVVPPLHGWHARFRVEAKPDRKISTYHRIGSSSTNRPQRNEIAENELLDFVAPLELAGGLSINIPSPDKSSIRRIPITLRETDSKAKGYKGVLSRSCISADLCNPDIRRVISRKKGVKWKALTSVNARRKNWTRLLHLEPFKTTYLPPDESRLLFQQISLKEASKIELDRILETVSLLNKLKTEYHESTRGFLADLVVQFNKLQLDSVVDSLIVDGLADFFRKHNYTKSIWYALSYHRSSFLNWILPPDAKLKLKDLQQTHPNLMLRFGNYFLMMISYLQDTTDIQMPLSRLCTLWDSVQPWVLMQLGAKQREADSPLSAYQPNKTFLDLKRRLQYLDLSPASKMPSFTKIRYGLQLDSEPDWDDDTQTRYQYRWYIFEKDSYSKELVAGCYDLGSKARAQIAVVPLDEQAEAAVACSSSSLIMPLLIAESESIPILYCADEEPYGSLDIDYTRIKWKPMGQLWYGTRGKGALARLKWLSTSYFGQFPTPKSEYLPKRPASSIQRMFDYLSAIYDELIDVTRARCRVSGSEKIGRIEFLNSSRMTIGTLRYVSMQSAVQILRTPYDAGMPLIIGKNELTWNPTSDIIYSNNLNQMKAVVEDGLLEF